MVSSVGKKLQQARLSKQLSLEEAARVTRIRPDKLIDLEEDNYANFPSMSYAKGFLLLYARFLNVDVTDFADTLHAPNPVSTEDYEYLNAASSGPSPPLSHRPYHTRRPYHFAPRREHTILPVIVFGVLAGCIVLAIYLIVTWNRLQGPDDLGDKRDASSAASPAISTLPAVSAATPVAAASAPALRNTPPAPSEIAAAPAAPIPTPAAGAAPSVPPVPPAPAPAGTFDPSREVRRAEPVLPSPPDHASASPLALPPVAASPPAPPPAASGDTFSAIAPAVSPVPDGLPGPIRQVTILPVRKTMVTIRKDVAGSVPIFEDWLYPGDGPLKLRGHKFWIQVKDPGAVQITEDGQPLAAGQTDIQIE